jgi:hypothetical protein
LKLVRRRLIAERRALALAAGACAFVLALPLSCGNPSHPPPLSDEGTGGGATSGSSSGPGNLAGDGAAVVPTCNLGPHGGVCACVDQPLLGDPPNLFFVLDRSGSMSESWGAGGDVKWTTVVNELTRVVVALGPRASYAVSLFPDPRFANAVDCAQGAATANCNACAPGVQAFPGIPGVPVLRGDAPAGTPGPHETALISMLNRAGAFGGTPTAATFASLAATIRSLPGKTYVIFATDGGPNCDSQLTCSAATCTVNIENQTGCPPSGPPNCCDPTAGAGTNLDCLDATATVAAVQAIATVGVPVYVIGVPQSEPYSALLDQLAQAGGTARGSEPQYYAASSTDPTALLAALKKIAAQITGTCKLTLDKAPPDPSLVNVFFDGSPLPQAGPDGWTLATARLDGGSETTVTVLGASCQKILDGDVLDVRVVAGCPTVTQ